MIEQANRYKCPSVSKTGDGTVRTVGFELEVSGLDLDQAVGVLIASMEATVRSKTDAECVLCSEALGDFTVELDWDYLKRKAAEEADQEESNRWLETLSGVAGLLVPLEIVCPPIPLDRLDELDTLVAALRNAGAVGTEDSLLAAYGVHINAEIPRLDAATLNAYLTAFGLLQWWLVEAHQVDITRKVSFYVSLYSDACVKQMLSRSSPSMDEIFSDYLEHNASRNRALDLLPLLAEIDDQRVKTAVDDQRIKARPTLHYRLPNCHIERDGWFLSQAWNIWWIVEELAAKPKEIAELREAYLAADTPVFGVNREKWVHFVDKWLRERELA